MRVLSRCLLSCLNPSSGRAFFETSARPAAASFRSMSTSSSSNVNDDANAFTELEHTNWQRGVDAYTDGFGPLTVQAVPTLLDRAGFFPTDGSTTANPNSSGCSFLDVACGPGQVVEAAISRAKSSKDDKCTYTALDFSSNFLELAQTNLSTKHPDTTVSFVEGDAQNLSSVFGENQFDVVACNFGILHLVDPDAFLREAFKVLKPGGRLAVSCWAAPPATEAFDLILGCVRDVGNPSVPLPDGPPFFRFAEERESQTSLEACGFDQIDVSVVESMEWTGVDSSDQLYQILLEGTARTRELLRGQRPTETKAIRDELHRRFDRVTATNQSDHGQSTRRLLRMPAVISSGRKPV